MDKSLKNTSKENKESREEIREEIKETGTLCLENDKHHHKIQMIFHVLLCVKSNGSKGQSWIVFHLAGVVSLNFVALKVEQILRIIDGQPFWVNFISVIVIIFAVT